jgi:16S rRNA (cytosine1402-N4)-methyltransferase
MSDSAHTPVLLQQVLEYLAPQPGCVIFDGTLGGGEYTRAISQAVGREGKVIAIDQDSEALSRFDIQAYVNVELHHTNFDELHQLVSPHSLDGVVLDLGISSDQLADEERGISFKNLDAPLDMRMNASESNKLTAWGILNTWSGQEIADALYHYGDERASRKIARAIVAQRDAGEMETVGDLYQAIHGCLPRRGKIDPATKSFQALRIVVNDELGSLERFLEQLPEYLASGARVVIVSFHSKEDRIVKQQFKQWKQENIATILTPKPIRPTDQEVRDNPRARSAKLRAIQFN